MKLSLSLFPAVIAASFIAVTGCASGASAMPPPSASMAKPSSDDSAYPAKPDAMPSPATEVAPGSNEGPPPQGQAMKAESSQAETKPIERKTLFLSADDSNSQASPVIARKFIAEGRYVPVQSVRTYEFLNYASFTYPPPPPGEDAAIYAHLHARDSGEYTLQAVLRSADPLPARLPLSVTVLIDASGSMAGKAERLEKEFVAKFADTLHAGDRISMVSFARRATPVLDGHQVGADTKATIEAALASIQANDVTDILEGIKEAYRLAGKNYSSKSRNLVVLVSDGGVNAGELALALIAESAKDADRQGIYLAGIGVGDGDGDELMNAVTDKGRGAYLFVDSSEEIDKMLAPGAFSRNFDLALRDVRMKMTMPPGWKLTEFHGEQVSEKASEVTPQYLAPGDQVIFHMNVRPPEAQPAADDAFEFEAEYARLKGPRQKLKAVFPVTELLAPSPERVKGDVITEFAEALKKVKFPPESNRDENLRAFDASLKKITALAGNSSDPEILEARENAEIYRTTLDAGSLLTARDRDSTDIAAVLNIQADTLLETITTGEAQAQAIVVSGRLGKSNVVMPREGHKFLMLSTGTAGSPSPSSSPPLGGKSWPDPSPSYHGAKKNTEAKRNVFDLNQVTLKLKAPQWAASFSFDFNFYSSEYPGFVNANYNDSFFAILRAASTNGGASTNVSFDANGNPVEVDNNYFQAPFHPLSNAMTGFDAHGSTGWLRTSWPIKGGETFTLTFSVHDEGDASWDSTVLIDNFRWNDYGAAGNTDPIN